MFRSTSRPLGKVAPAPAWSFAVGRLVDVLGHDLRSHLEVIARSADVLHLRLPSADRRTRSCIRRIHERVRACAGALEAVRRRTRVREPRPIAVLVKSVLEATLAAARLPAEVRVVRRFPEAGLIARGDPDQLVAALGELVANAAEALRNGGGTITVAARRARGGMVEISVRDTGVGIPRGDLTRVFDPFITTKPGRLGLGLALSRAIVERQGGSIGLESLEGRGTKVLVSLIGGGAGEDGVLARRGP